MLPMGGGGRERERESGRERPVVYGVTCTKYFEDKKSLNCGPLMRNIEF